MKRKTLITLKNGRHRVATPSEAASLHQVGIASRDARAKGYQIQRLIEEMAPLKREFDINSRLLEALVQEFGDKARPHIENFIRIAEANCGRRLASLGASVDVSEVAFRRHVASIPKIVVCYNEELRPGSARG